MKVVGTNITMTRGDSESITVTMTDTNDSFVPFEAGDLLYFTVKETIGTDNIMLQKKVEKFEEGSALIEILPDDTKDWRPFEYIYDVQLSRGDGTVSTIIKPSAFKVEGDVTRD